MLTLRCTLLRSSFEGASSDDSRAGEWPPSWMRLFSAFVSVADMDNPQEISLLECLESATPPQVHASQDIVRSQRSAFVPTNKTGISKHTALPARTNGERTWARTIPRSPVIWYRWPALDLGDGARERLAQVCRRIPYLGRSTSPAIIEVVGEAPSEGQWLVPWQETDGREAEFVYAQAMRCPHPGSLDLLRSAFEAKYLNREAGDPWQVGLLTEYGYVRTRAAAGETAGPYQTLVVFAIEGPKLDGRHAARITSDFRRAVLSRAQPHLATLHGHHRGEVVQCAFLALPFVGARHADGHLLGLAVAVPELPREQVLAVQVALEAVEASGITAGPLGVVSLRRVSPLEGTRRLWSLQPRRWTGPAREWSTVLPIVFDRYLKRGDDIEALARKAITNSLLPEPESVFLSRYPLLPGAPDLAPNDTLRRHGDSGFKPYRHAVIRFAQPVRGPVIIGSMRHYGLGLCAPVDEP